MTQSINNINLDYELRFAHIDGHTDLDFVPGKKYFPLNSKPNVSIDR